MSTARWLFPAVALCLSLSLSHAAQMLSIDFTGTRSGNVGVGEPFAISADGRFVAFSSTSTNHVPNDTNGANDLFVHDCALRKHIWDTTHATHFPPSGAGGGGYSSPWSFTPDGRFLVFVSTATNLVSGFTFSSASSAQLYIHDLLSNITALVSVSHDGSNVADRSFFSVAARRGVISSDGRFVSFSSSATNLVAVPDVNFGTDVFCRDLASGITELITVPPSGNRTLDVNVNSFLVSTNARFFAFDTSATNVVDGLSPTNRFTHVYWRDRLAETNALVTITWDGAFPVGGGTLRDMSSDGRFVCFQSLATNIVPTQNDSETTSDLFIRDMFLGETWLVSRDTNGAASRGRFNISDGQFSANGRVLTFSALVANLAPGITDVNGTASDLFAHYVVGQSNVLVSASRQGNTGADWYTSDGFAKISATGRYVLFTSTATNLLPDRTGPQRLYLRDLEAGRTLDPLRSSYFPTPAFNEARLAISDTERYIFFLTQDNFDSTVTDANLKRIDLFRAPLYQPKFLSARPLVADALPNTTYVLESSADLRNWSAASTNVSDPQGQIIYTLNSSHPARFFRLLWP